MPSRPNILLIALDTLRADHMGVYGYSRPTTPRIDDLAAEAVVFDQCIAGDIPTHPAFTSLFTGRRSHVHGVIQVGGKVEPPATMPMLTEVLAAHGYRTYAADNLGRWMTRGFQRYETYTFPRGQGEMRKAEIVNALAIPMLREAVAGDDPFFLFVHYWDPHTPYLPPKPYKRLFYDKPEGYEKDPRLKGLAPAFAFDPFAGYFMDWMGDITDVDYVIAQYDGAIAYLDREVGRLLDVLALSGKLDDTVVILVADHGEVLTEHNGWFDHHGLYDCNVRVPLIIRYPARFPAGRRVEAMVQHIDLFPTLLELAGIPPVEGVQGRSLLPVVDGVDPGYQEVFLSEATWQCKRGVRTREWKFIKALKPDFHGGPERELYNLVRDPDEQVNVIVQNPEVARDLEARLEAWLAEELARAGRQVDPIVETGESLKKIGAGNPLEWRRLAANR